jgi:hypothetical protein
MPGGGVGLQDDSATVAASSGTIDFQSKVDLK